MSSVRRALLEDGVADLVQDLHESIVGALVGAGMPAYSYRERGAVHTLNDSAPERCWPRGDQFDADLAGGRGRWS